MFEKLLIGLAIVLGPVPHKDTSVSVGEHHQLYGHPVIKKIHCRRGQDEGGIDLPVFKGLLYRIPARHAKRFKPERLRRFQTGIDHVFHHP